MDVQNVLVLWKVFNNVDPRRDTMIVDGPLKCWIILPPCPAGIKMGIDAAENAGRRS